ncbi:MAG: hypothetical protein IT445_04420 [Phycisphaeraceae bacterium]|nr:hypothetical protein [Phycisphaeraceae bacterium]
MAYVIAIYLVCLALLLMLYIWLQYRSRRRDLLCLRNIFLVGFILFQLTSPALSLWLMNFGKMPVMYPVKTGIIYSIMATLFLILFMVAYHKCNFLTKWAHKVKMPAPVPDNFLLAMLSLMFLATSALLCLVVKIPYVFFLSVMLGVGCAGIAAGLISWLWARRPWNLPLLVLTIIIVLVAMALSVTGAFGRRPLVTVAMAVLVACYFANWRYRPPHKIMIQFIVISLLGTVVLSYYTAARDPGEHKRSAMQHFQAMMTANPTKGLLDLMAGQNTGSNSFWLIENFPKQHPYRWFMTVRGVIEYPIPRNLYTSKPEGLGILIPTYIRQYGVALGQFNVGPGIIGHAAAEGGFPPLIVYALLYGMLLRFLDDLLAIHSGSVLAVLVLFSAAGQTLAVPRGESSSFTFIWLFTVVSTWVVARLYGNMARLFAAPAS